MAGDGEKKRMKALIIDDERPVRIAISRLGKWGMYGFDTPVQVENGRDGLKAMHELHPEVVFVDMQMPVMDGIEFLKQASADFPESVYIVVSGYDDFRYAQNAIRYGALDYLLKPVAENDLNAAIEKAVGKIKPDAAGDSKQTGSISVDEAVEILKSKLDNDYAENIKIGDFAEKYYFSKEYLSKVFKARYGSGVYEYLLKVRMERAAGLLRDPDIRIIDISSRIGYTDNNYFSKAFRNYYGMTPTEYRKSSEAGQEDGVNEQRSR
jgi:two-component system response regulator YesN